MPIQMTDSMPIQMTASRIVQPSQFLLRSDVLSSVLLGEPPPTNAPKPLGDTPLWCTTAPDGSNNGIFFEASTGDAIYFPSYAIDTFDDGKPKVKFSQPVKSSIATTLTITLKPQSPTAAQIAAASAAGKSPLLIPEHYNVPIAVVLFFSSGTKQLTFDQIVTGDSAGRLVCTANMNETNYPQPFPLATTIGEVMGSLVSHDSSGPHAWITVTRTISVGVLTIQPAPPAPPAQPAQPAPKSMVFTPAPFVTEPQVARFAVVSRQPAFHIALASAENERAMPITDFPFRRRFPQDPPPPPPPPPAAPLYRLMSGVAVATSVKDVWFLDTISAGITSDVTGVQPMQAAYEQHTVAGYDYPLFRDVNSETAYYYLPEAFKIARRATAPFLPLIDVVLHGATLDDAQATIFFTALPVVDMNKLSAARDTIQKEHAGQVITLEPLATPANIEYGLYLPGSTLFSKRNVPVSLDQALTDQVDLSLADFQTVLASLTATVPKYLQGKITVHFGDNIESVPLTARADDFPGAYFQQARSVDDANAAIRLTLVNSIESAVRVDALPISATRAGMAVPSTIVFDPPLPATIAAVDDTNPTGGSLTAIITPSSGPVDETLKLVVDQSQCHVVPDPTGLLHAVLDPNAPIKVSRPVAVRIPTVLFGTDPEPPPSPKNIIGITVIFQNGNTITLQRPNDLSAMFVVADPPGTVNMSVFDYLVRQSSGEASPIKYKLELTYRTGHTVTDPDWRTSPVDNITLDLP